MSSYHLLPRKNLLATPLVCIVYTLSNFCCLRVHVCVRVCCVCFPVLCCYRNFFRRMKLINIGVFTPATGWLYQLSEKLDDPINSERSNIPSAFTSYISALYFTCTSLTSVGFGNVSPNTNAEKVFSVAAMLIGGTRRFQIQFSSTKTTLTSFELQGGSKKVSGYVNDN